jgi:hypothetical protein
MRSPWGNAEVVATEIGGRFQAGKDRIVRPLFGPIARVIWPSNTDAHVASIAKCDPRTARRYLSGEIDPPSIVWVSMWLVAIESRDPK